LNKSEGFATASHQWELSRWSTDGRNSFSF